MADSPDRKSARPRATLGGVEPLMHEHRADLDLIGALYEALYRERNSLVHTGAFSVHLATRPSRDHQRVVAEWMSGARRAIDWLDGINEMPVDITNGFRSASACLAGRQIRSLIAVDRSTGASTTKRDRSCRAVSDACEQGSGSRGRA